MNRKLIMCLVEKIDRAIFLDNDCWEHACHLCVLGSLKLVDQMMHVLPQDRRRSWKYYSSIATVCNVCRDVARDLFDTWKQFHGCESATQQVRKLFPRCCAGRWLSISTAEERIIKSTEHMLKGVLTAVLKKKKVQENDDGDVGLKSAKKPKTAVSKSEVGVGTVDLLAVEQTQHYVETMGKWRRHAVEAVSDTLWHRTIAVLNAVKGPLTHFSCFLKKKLTEMDLRQHGNVLHRLVSGKSDVFMAEFATLLSDLAVVARWSCNHVVLHSSLDSF